MARPTSEASRRGGRRTTTAATRVLVVVPNGTLRPDALAAAVRRHHPTWSVSAAWCGDPQLRPACGDVDWLAAVAPSGDDVLRLEPEQLERRVAIDGCLELLGRGASHVVVLHAGSSAVLGPLDELVPHQGELLRLVPRLLAPPIVDGLVPDLAATMAAGWWSTTAWAAAKGSEAILAAVRADDGTPFGFEAAAARSDVGACRSDRIGAGAWRWPNGSRPNLLDLPGFDASRPWALTPNDDREARIEVADHHQRRAELDEALPQLTGHRRPPRLPGGIVVGADIRRALAAPIATDGTDSVGRQALARTYWRALHASRPDLRAAFPEGAESESFIRWASASFAADTMPFLVPMPPRSSLAAGRISVTVPPADGGVNVVGYFSRSSSLGDVARRLVDVVREAGIPVSTVDHHRTQSPVVGAVRRTDDVVRYATTIAVVNADQFDGLLADIPGLRGGRRLVGYWFWEVAHVPPVMRAAMRHVDEIWAGTRFVSDAIAAESPVPVRLVPLPVPCPEASTLDARKLAPWYDHRGRFAFLVTFDHLSVMARKNPMAAIEAYRRAFADGERTLLIVRTANAALRADAHEELLAAAGGREDIRVWDRSMSHPDLMAVVRDADCLVSLHRSEGLGLHLIEAMWMGTPTIATRWSGNVDFMDDTNSLLIDARLVPVRGGDRVYSPLAHWADPNLDQAATAMRRIVDEEELARELARAATTTMQRLANPAPTAALLRDLLTPVAAR